MPAKKSHEVTIRVRFDAPMTAEQARYAVWNAFDGQTLYGDGKGHGTSSEPYEMAKVTVRRSK